MMVVERSVGFLQFGICDQIMHSAVKYYNCEVLKILLEAKGDVNVRDQVSICVTINATIFVYGPSIYISFMTSFQRSTQRNLSTQASSFRE